MKEGEWRTTLMRRARRVNRMKPLSRVRTASIRAADARVTKATLEDTDLTRDQVNALIRTYHDVAPLGSADHLGSSSVYWPGPRQRFRREKESLIRIAGWTISPIDGVWRDRRPSPGGE